MRVAVVLAALVAARAAVAQTKSTACDSIVANAAVDHVESALYLSVQRVDGEPVSDAASREMALQIASAFVPPQPFTLSVFSGPALMRGLRARGDTNPETLRAPTLTGEYRAMLTRPSSRPVAGVVRRSMMAGFDSLAVDAIQTAIMAGGVFTPTQTDSLPIEVTFSTDSQPSSVRLVSARFPRMPVVDAAVRADSPPPVAPATRNDDAVGPVVLRFVVGQDGMPVPRTAAIVRATSADLLRASLANLEQQRFSPATIHGCPVQQQIDLPFVFPP